MIFSDHTYLAIERIQLCWDLPSVEDSVNDKIMVGNFQVIFLVHFMKCRTYSLEVGLHCYAFYLYL
jgi:hypothetical protein